MAGNSTPQFCMNGNLGTPQNVTAANTSSQGGGTIATNMYNLFQAGANGSYVEYVRIMPTASVASTALAATVIRIFASAVASGATSSTDTHLIAEIALSAITADSPTVANVSFDIPLMFRLPANWTLLASTHVAAPTNTAWKCLAVGGDY